MKDKIKKVFFKLIIIPILKIYVYTMLLLLFSRLVVFNSLWPHGLQHARLPCALQSPGVCPSSCPLYWWYYPAISSSVIPFSSCIQSFPTSGSFPVTWLFLLGDQSIGVSTSASVLPKNIQGWFPLRLTGLIFLLSKELSRVFPSLIAWKHQFFGAWPSLGFSSHNHMWLQKRLHSLAYTMLYMHIYTHYVLYITYILCYIFANKRR